MPFDLPEVKPGSDIEILFKAVGFITIQWGHAEQTLDLIVDTIYRSAKDSWMPNKPPQFLKPKIDFLFKCFDKIPELSQFKPEIEVLFPRFSAVGKERNDIIHGAIAALSIEDNAFTLLKIDINQENRHSFRLVYLENSKWIEFRRELISLGKDGNFLARKVWDILKGQNMIASSAQSSSASSG